MLRIALADSDADNARHFRTYIKVSCPDAKIVGVSVSASSFLRDCGDSRPNLVVGDIAFFGRQGWQTIRESSELYPDVKFIVYGHMSDLPYIEKAMEYGVIDYMFKPVKPVEFERCLNRARSVIERIETERSEKERVKALCDASMALFKDRFIINVLQGHAGGEFDIHAGLRYFNITLRPPYVVFITRIDHYRQIMLTLDEPGKHALVFEMDMFIADKLSALSCDYLTIINRFNCVAVVLGNIDNIGDGIYAEKLPSLCHEIKDELRDKKGLSVTMGIGRVYGEASGITTSFREAVSAVRHRHYVGYNTVIPIQYVEPNNDITHRYPISKEEELVASAAAGEYEQCEKLTGDLIDALKKCEPLPEKLASKIVLDIVVSINRLTDEQRLPYSVSVMSFFPSAEIAAINTVDDAKRFLIKSLKRYCSYMNSLRDGSKGELLRRAKEHVADNYFTNLSLSGVARLLNVTPEFLGGAFNEYEGCSFPDYVARVRIAEAKALMEQGADEESASKAVGYVSVKYFRSLMNAYSGSE